MKKIVLYEIYFEIVETENAEEYVNPHDENDYTTYLDRFIEEFEKLQNSFLNAYNFVYHQGSPASNPYIQIQTETKAEARKYEKELLKLFRKYDSVVTVRKYD